MLCSTGCAHDPFTLSSSEIRPRAHRLIRKEDLQVGDVVLVNYNPDDPLEFGYWYDFVVSAVGDDNISGTVRIGNGETVLEDCKVKFVNCIMKIEETVLNTERLEVVNISYKSMFPSLYRVAQNNSFSFNSNGNKTTETILIISSFSSFFYHRYEIKLLLKFSIHV